MSEKLRKSLSSRRFRAALVALFGAVLLTLLGSTSLRVANKTPNASPVTTEPTKTTTNVPSSAEGSIPIFNRWESFTTKEGLPSNKVFCVRVEGSRVWAGTENGLACYENGRWKTYGVQDGLPHQAVLSLDVSRRTGDLWVGTMGGLARFSSGRFDAYHQLDSGLSNDFIQNVRCDSEEDVIWAATAMGLNYFNIRTGEWRIYSEENTPMHEPWTYAVAQERGKVYLAAWGGGVLEYDKKADRWREFADPDKQMEIDLLPNDGPVHDVTSGVEYADGILWQITYFGAARYDGREWRTYFKENSGLVGNFLQFVRARGRVAWFCSDEGLGASDGDRWVAYQRLDNGQGEIRTYEGSRSTGRYVTPTAFAHNFVLGVDFQGDSVWVATENGVSRGTVVPGVGGAPRELAFYSQGAGSHGKGN